MPFTMSPVSGCEESPSSIPSFSDSSRYCEDLVQEVESILDNPNEMADMYLASKEAALEAEAEQASLRCPI